MASTKKKGKLIRKIVLPFPLCTWNRLLSANRWLRSKIRHWLHDAVADILNDIPITGDRLDVYYQLIRPKVKKKSTGKRKRRSR